MIILDMACVSEAAHIKLRRAKMPRIAGLIAKQEEAVYQGISPITCPVLLFKRISILRVMVVINYLEDGQGRYAYRLKSSSTRSAKP